MIRAKVLNLSSNNPSTLEYVFLPKSSISINLAKKKLIISMIKKVLKSIKKRRKEDKFLLIKSPILTYYRQEDTYKIKSKPLRKNIIYGRNLLFFV